MNIIEEVKFPTKDTEWIIKVLIGGIIALIPIVNFLAFGYYLKVMKGAIEGNPAMPKWEDWGGLFINGLKVFIIELVYMIIPLLVIGISVGGAVLTALSGGAMEQDLFMGAMATAIGGALIGILLVILFGLLVPMAVAMFAKEGSIGAAFRVGEVLSRIKSVLGDYITVYIVLILLVFILGILTQIPVLGFLIWMFGSFYVIAVAYNMFGKTYAKSSP
jgi:hypothetical protein